MMQNEGGGEGGAAATTTQELSSSPTSLPSLTYTQHPCRQGSPLEGEKDKRKPKPNQATQQNNNNNGNPHVKVPSLKLLSNTRIEGEVEENYTPRDPCLMIKPARVAKKEKEEPKADKPTQEEEEASAEEEEEECNIYRIFGIPVRIPLPVLFPLMTFLAISIVSIFAFVPCWKARESVMRDTAVIGRREIMEHALLFRKAFLGRVVSEFTRIVRNTMATASILWQHLPIDTVIGGNFTVSNNLDMCEDVFKPVSLSYTHLTTVALLMQQNGRENMFYVHIPPNKTSSYIVGVLDTSMSNKRFLINQEVKDYDDTLYLDEWNLSMSRAVPGKELRFDQIPLWNAVKNSSNEMKSMWTITNSFILSDFDPTVIAYSKKITIPRHKNRDKSARVCNGGICIDEKVSPNDNTVGNGNANDDSSDTMVGVVCTILTHSKMQELFGSLPVTKNGISFVTDGSSELKMIASRNIDVFYNKPGLEQISTLVHPSPVVREIAQLFSTKVLPDHATISTEEPLVGEFSLFGNATSVDYEMIPLGEPGHHWWLFVATPQKDFFEETLTEFAQTERNLTYASIRTSIYATIVIVLCVIVSIFLSTNIRRVAKEIENCANLRTDTPQLRVNTMFLEIAEICDRTSRLKLTLESYRRYVPMPVVRMGIMGSQTPKLGVSPHYATIMFLDVVNFTYLSDLFCDRMLEVLNRMFDEFSKILIDHGAVIDKYIGDAIMAFWNVPSPVPNSEEAAVRSAVAIMSKLEQLNTEDFYPRLDTRMRVRIGINCGTVNAGNVGVPQRINYTVLGKHVNIAAHLEPFNKELGTRVLVSSAVREACGSCKDIRFRCLGKTCLKGMSEEVVVNQVLGDGSYIPSQYRESGMISDYELIDRKLLALFSEGSSGESNRDCGYDGVNSRERMNDLKKDYQTYLIKHESDTAAKYFYDKMFK